MTQSPSEPEPPSPVPALTVAAVARRLGVAPATLRTWDRRYGVGPSAHTAGSHRRYTPADVARLTVMRRLTLEGVTPAEAARVVLATGGQPEPVAVPPAPPVGPLAVPVPGPTAHGDGPEGPNGTGGAGGAAAGGGGRVIALPHSSASARGLARSAMALDSEACAEVLRTAFRRDGVVEAWESLVAPVLVGIGQRWAATGECVDAEHLLSECLVMVLHDLRSGLTAPRNRRPVLLACAEEEQHALPLHVLAAALAEQRVAARVLGARVPQPALVSAVRRTGPAAVLVWSQLPETGRPELLAALPPQRPRPLVLAGGPGWAEVALPERVRHAADLRRAVAHVLDAVGG